MKRVLYGLLAVLVVVAVAGFLFLRSRSGPPELPGELKSLPVAPAPVLSPEEELATFRLEPGYRIELVASEPLIEDPVALAWDGQGRLFVVEMRGYMPNLEAEGEEEPVGKVVLLEDHDGDGRMDESTVFLDELVLPRAVAVLPQGILIAEPPNLWLCKDEDEDRRCDEKIRVAAYGEGGENVEHTENGLLPGIDGWLYNAKSRRRFRFEGDNLIEETTLFRGQWGIAQDDAGRLYSNTNSNFAFLDAHPAELFMRHPGMRPATGGVPGALTDLAPGNAVLGIRAALGANRAYLEGELRPDGRLTRPTGASGIAVQRSPALGADRVGDVFVPEVVANAVVRLKVDVQQATGEPMRVPDPEWEEREFLTSTHERFRPVNVAFGPYGELLVVDMYRGIIQHKTYVSDYLRDYIERQGMERPLGLGRIWRVVKEDATPRALPEDPATSTRDARLALLGDVDGSWRDMASRWLVAEGGEDVDPGLRETALQASPRARASALWSLAQRGGVEGPLLRSALEDDDPNLRLAAWKIAATADPSSTDLAEVLEGRVAAGLSGEDRVPAALALSSFAARPASRKALMGLIGDGSGGPMLSAAAFSGLAGREQAFATELLEDPAWAGAEGERASVLSDLSRLGFLRLLAAPPDDAIADEGTQMVGWLGGLADGPAKTALLAGLGQAAALPGLKPLVLPEAPALFEKEPEGGDAVLQAWREARSGITWIGDENVPGAVPLTEADKVRMAAGQVLYESACVSCHQGHGRGQAGLAPPLTDASWVLDSDGWLTRIVLQGMSGPVEIAGTTWNGAMPAHGHDPRFDDEAVAGLLTFLRRSWGHVGAPVLPETVASIRAETEGRAKPWTAEELLDLDVDHVLERYVGKYAPDGFPLTVTVTRDKTVLRVTAPLRGETELQALPDGSFSFSDGTNSASLIFVEQLDGRVAALQLTYGEQKINMPRVE